MEIEKYEEGKSKVIMGPPAVSGVRNRVTVGIVGEDGEALAMECLIGVPELPHRREIEEYVGEYEDISQCHSGAEKTKSERETSRLSLPLPCGNKFGHENLKEAHCIAAA